MARTALAIGGGIAGFLIGGPTGAALGFSIGNLLGGVFFGDDISQNTVITGPRLSDTQVSTSTYGKGIPIVFGAVRVGGNMIWATDIAEVRSEETIEQEGGGKGAPDPPSQTNVTFAYFGNFAMSFAEGPGFIRRIWANGTLIVDLSDEFATGASKVFKYGGGHYRIYRGTSTQFPDPLIEADKGVGNVPGHRDQIYVVFEQLPLRDFGNRLPQIHAEVVKGAPTVFTAINSAVNGGISMNRDGDYIDRSFGGHLGYNSNGQLIIYDRVTRQPVDQLLNVGTPTRPDSESLKDAEEEVFTLVNNFDQGLPFADPSDGLFGMEVRDGNDGGVAIFIGQTEGDRWPEDMRTGRWQVAESDDSSARFGINRLFKVDGVRYLFMTTGLADGGRITATPFIEHNIGTPSVPIIIKVVRTTATQVPGSILYNGPIVEDASLDTGGPLASSWFSAAHDPAVGAERVWFVNGNNQITQFTAGAFTAAFDLNTVLDTLHETGGTFEVRGIAYDKTTDSIIVMCDDDHFLVNVTTFAVEDFAGPNTATPVTTAASTGHAGGFTENMWGIQETVERIFHTTPDSNTLARFGTDDLTAEISHYDDPDFTGASWEADEGVYFDPLLSAFFSTLSNGTWGFVDRLGRDGVVLGTIVDDLVARTDVLDNTDTDVIALTDIVSGYLVENPGTLRSMIEPLQQAYFFDGAEIDGILEFKKRDGTSFITITSEELGARVGGGESNPQNLVEPRKQEIEVPRQIDVTYMNPNNDYQLGTQRDQRIQENPTAALAGITRSKHTVTMRLPLVLTDQQARDIASQALSSAWVERTSLQFTLPPKFARLDPTDIITIQKISSFLTADLVCRLTNVEMGEAGVLTCQALLTEVAVYQPNVTAQIIDGSPAGPIPFPAATELFLLNLPNIRGLLDNDGGLWWGAAPDLGAVNVAWTGATLFKALIVDGPQSQVDSTLVAVQWGKLTSVTFPAESRFTVRDRTNTLDIRLVTSGTLASIDDLTLFAGGNFAYIPSSGELLQFQNATLNADGTYTLDTFLRGRLGTEVFIAGSDDVVPIVPTKDDEIILLGTLSSFQRTSNFNERGILREYEAVTIGGQLGEEGNDTETFTGTSEASIPLSPSSFIGTRDGSDNIDLTWLRRDRFNHEWLDLVDIPMNEQGEEYEVDVLDSPDPADAIVVRTFTGLLTELVEYAIADQQADVLHSGDFPFAPTVPNGGFEVDTSAVATADPPTITNWSTDGIGSWGTAASITGITGPRTGSFFAFTQDGGPTVLTLLSDDIPINDFSPAPLNMTELDTNLGRFQIAVTAFSATGDLLTVETRVDVTFVDGAGADISTSTGTASGHSGADSYESRSVGAVDIPVGTRAVRITLRVEDVPATSNVDIGWDDVTISITDTASGTVQRFAFDVYQLSATVGRGRGRRTTAPAVGT